MRTFTEQQSLAAYSAAPPLIQNALSSDDLISFALSMPSTYNLHADVAGSINSMIGNTLIGLLSPAEFFAGLLELGLTNDVAQRLTNDLNTKVFMPIHQKMLEGGPDTIPSATVSVPAPAPVVPTTTAEEAPLVPPTAPLVAHMPSAPVSSEPMLASVPAYVPPPVQSVSEFSAPSAPTLPGSMPPVQAPTPMPVSAPVSAPTIASTTAPISAPRPTPEPMPIPPAPRMPVRMNATETANRDELHHVLKEYGIDPYREPVDDSTS